MLAKHKLQKVEQQQGILYMLERGPCPVWIMKLYCPGILVVHMRVF
jgi:hypothetical protein